MKQEGLFGIEDVEIKLRPKIKGTGRRVRSAAEVYETSGKRIGDSAREVFLVLSMNTKNEIIKKAVHMVGTVDSSAVYPREIIGKALLCDATALIFIHNHPCGDPDTSLCDRDITRSLVMATELMQIKTLDHLMVGEGRYYSFADYGLIDEYRLQFSGLSR